MSTLSVIAVAVAVAAIALVAVPMIRLYLRYRGTRVVTCPENQEAVAVEVDASQAAFSNLENLHLRLKECTRWPERENCGQECLSQIEAAPEDCLLKAIITRWYVGKTCAVCGRNFGEIRWSDHKPALLGPEHKTVEWSGFRPETVHEVLATHAPVCWDCHVAATFRREHPELVVDRPWKTPGH
jgi:hypothetical protein